MKIIITLDPSLAIQYALRDNDRFKASMHLATEKAIIKQDENKSGFGHILLNRPNAIQVETE